MTWADVGVILFTTDWLERISVFPCWEDYPLLNGLKQRVEALPQRWLKQVTHTLIHREQEIDILLDSVDKHCLSNLSLNNISNIS